MEKENKKHSIFNVFDLVLIGIAAVLAAVLILSRFVSPQGGDQPNMPVGLGDGKVTYTVEFILDEDQRDFIHVGDRVTDRVKHYNLGTVEAVEVTDALRYVPDFTTGKVVGAAIPGQVAVRVTITGGAVVTNKGTMVDGGYPLYLGINVNAVFPEINVNGMVVNIERGQAQ